MNVTTTHRILLGVGSLLALLIGSSILLAPTTFYAANGITLTPSPDLMSEIRAPGAALLVLGTVMLTGVLRDALTAVGLTVATAVFLAYGGARLLSIALDGAPGTGLLVAAGIELVIGLLCARALRQASRPIPARPRAPIVTARSR